MIYSPLGRLEGVCSSQKALFINSRIPSLFLQDAK